MNPSAISTRVAPMYRITCSAESSSLLLRARTRRLDRTERPPRRGPVRIPDILEPELPRLAGRLHPRAMRGGKTPPAYATTPRTRQRASEANRSTLFLAPTGNCPARPYIRGPDGGDHADRPSPDDDGRRDDRTGRQDDADYDGQLPEARREGVLRRDDLPSGHRRGHDPGRGPEGHWIRRPWVRDQGRAPPGEPEREGDDLDGERGPEHRRGPVLHQRRGQPPPQPEASRVRG